MINTEDSEYRCPFDGKKMEDIYEDKFGINFCSELCKQRYYFLVYNNINRELAVGITGSFKKRELIQEPLRITLFFDTNPLVVPNICIFCGHAKDFIEPEVQLVDYTKTWDEQGQNPRKITRRYRAWHGQYCVPICRYCRELMSSIHVNEKGIRCKPKTGELNGIKLQNPQINADFEVNRIGLIEITTRNKYFLWNLLRFNPFQSNPTKFQDVMVAFTAINPKSAYDWIEHRVMKNWTQIYLEMVEKGLPYKEKVGELFGNQEEAQPQKS
jgi:hypothetical protein